MEMFNRSRLNKCVWRVLEFFHAAEKRTFLLFVSLRQLDTPDRTLHTTNHGIYFTCPSGETPSESTKVSEDNPLFPPLSPPGTLTAVAFLAPENDPDRSFSRWICDNLDLKSQRPSCLVRL